MSYCISKYSKDTAAYVSLECPIFSTHKNPGVSKNITNFYLILISMLNTNI